MRQRIACLMLAAGALAQAQAQPAAPSASVERVDDAIVFRGRIDGASAAAFLALVLEPGLRRVVITSGGGLVGAALGMAEAIHERGLDVEVPQACLSSCANYVFPAGRAKHLGHPRAVGWHGNMAHVLHLAQTGQASWGDAAMQEARQLAAREEAFFRRIGIDGFVCWFGKLAPHGIEAFYTVSPRDMARFGIGDVTVGPGTPGPDAPQLLVADWLLMDVRRPAVEIDAR